MEISSLLPGPLKALSAGVLVGLLFPLWVAAAAAVIVALGDLGHYYQNGPAASWRKGARGERKTARALAPLAAAGYVALHDRAIPNSSANIDHIVVGPGRVWVLVARLRWLAR